uniref:C2 domain-containing protein n=1 Tax=Myripristis murdjan TaxID=586833 RepID=A0A668AU17_9TELE
MSLAAQSQQWCPTSVQVAVLQARGLRIKGKNGTNDAYAVMQVAKEKYATSVVQKSVAPMWEEEAVFDLPPVHPGGSESCTLHITVLHRALMGPDKLLGQAAINLWELSEDKPRNKTEWFKLLGKTGKVDRDRGEVLMDIQFMRNNKTASMFDLSATGKPRSRLGKFKDKVQGKKREDLSVASSTMVPSVLQVLTDSEEEGTGDSFDENAAGKGEKKKKHKFKSLLSPKSNLQRNMSQSMCVLPEKNSTVSGSISSGLNVDASGGKKKFRFMIHKSSGSSESSGSQGTLSVPGRPKEGTVEQSKLCINGSHIYCEEPQPRSFRTSSNLSLSSSGHSSMKEICRTQTHKNSGTSVDSFRTQKQHSPWTEEEHSSRAAEEEMFEEEEVRLEEDKKRREELERIRMEGTRAEVERKKRQEEEERVRKQKEENERLAEKKRRLEEEEWKRIQDEEKNRQEQEMRMEKERFEEERKSRQEEEDRHRNEEEERKRLAEERRRLEEEERRRIEKEEKNRKEQEKMRMEKERAEEERKRRQEEEDRLREREEERKRLAEELKRLEEEERRIEEEERIQKEEQEKMRLESKRAEEEIKRRQEEEEKVKKQKEENERLAEKKRRLEEEEWKRIQDEEKNRQEQEMMRMEKERFEEERKGRQEEEDRHRNEEEERKRLAEERRRLEEEERRRIEEEEKNRKEQEKMRMEKERAEEEEKMRQEEEDRLRNEEEERKRLAEERRRLEEEERRRIEKEEKNRKEQEKMRMEKERAEEERKRRQEEEDRLREKEEERKRLAEELKRLEEEERRRIEEEERIQKEEQERMRLESKRAEEEIKRRQEEEEKVKKQKEENERLGEKKRRLEEEEWKRIQDEEKNRQEQEKEEAREEKKRSEEEKTGREEEEISKMEKERVEETWKWRQEEEERARKQEEEKKSLTEERRRLGEERKRIEEEEKMRCEEDERIRKQKEENDRLAEETRRLEEQEKLREEKNKMKEERRLKDAEDRQKQVEGKKRLRKEEEEREERETAGEVEESNNPFTEVTSTNPFDDNYCTDVFEETGSSAGGAHSTTARVSTVQLRCHSTASLVGSKEDLSLKVSIPTNGNNRIRTQWDRQPAPQPPGSNRTERQIQKKQNVSTPVLAQMNKQTRDKDVKTSSVSPLHRSASTTQNTQVMESQSSTQLRNQQEGVLSTSGASRVTKNNKGPAPSRLQSSHVGGNTLKQAGEFGPFCEPKEAWCSDTNQKDSNITCDSVVKQVPVVYGSNPFEDDKSETEVSATNEVTTSGNTNSTDSHSGKSSACVHAGSLNLVPAAQQTPDEAGMSQTKSKSSKMARAPLPPTQKAAPSSILVTQNMDFDLPSKTRHSVTDVDVPDNAVTQGDDPHHNVTAQGSEQVAGRKEDGTPSTSCRLHPVKPLNQEHKPVSVTQAPKDSKYTAILSDGQEKVKVNKAGLKRLYTQLNQEELVSLVIKQESLLLERDKKISELEQYIDNLLVRIMEEKPSILMSSSVNSVKKGL